MKPEISRFHGEENDDRYGLLGASRRYGLRRTTNVTADAAVLTAYNTFSRFDSGRSVLVTSPQHTAQYTESSYVGTLINNTVSDVRFYSSFSVGCVKGSTEVCKGFALSLRLFDNDSLSNLANAT